MDRRRTFAGNVHGVVVQTTTCSSFSVEQREANEERRVGAILVDAGLREPCWESDVPQRGHHSVDRWPMYSEPRSWTIEEDFQMYSMFVPLNVK